MVMDNRRIGYNSYWVAYFDFLGFEDRVKNERVVWPIIEDYQMALNEIRANSVGIHCKWFSDTFLFYTPDESIKAFNGIEYACQSFFCHMIKSLIPVRGCLTVSDFWEDATDGVLVGPALIEAYRLAECQDWLGFVLSPKATRRREQYAPRGDYYFQYDVPVDHSKSTRRLDVFAVSHRFFQVCCPEEWWRYLDDMEGLALDSVKQKGGRVDEGRNGRCTIEDDRNRVLRKYRNSKDFLRRLYPQLVDTTEG